MIKLKIENIIGIKINILIEILGNNSIFKRDSKELASTLIKLRHSSAL
jgi:hypothetical protein